MILGSAIPLNPDEFIRNCNACARTGQFAKPASRYLDYLVDQTKCQYPALYRYVKVFDRETGADRYSADTDHIIPRKVWNILMPEDLRGMPDEDFPGYSGVISNLFWRDKQFNRIDDTLAIKPVKEARALNRSKEEASKWRATWIALFITTKHNEGVLCTAEPHDPAQMDQLIGPSHHSNWMAFGKKGD